MKLEKCHQTKLLGLVSQINTTGTFTTVLKTSLTEPQMGVMPFADTILERLNILGDYRAFTLGQLACHTGIPVNKLYGIITSETGEHEAFTTARDRLIGTIQSLQQPVTA